MRQYLSFILLLIGSVVNAQSFDTELPTIIPPSPSVASLMRFEEIPTDYYTGQPNIGIPLLAKKVNDDLTIGASLLYNTQGVKIASRSSWVGTGWSLNIGGVISRTVRGFPDENSDYHRLGVLHNDDFWNYESLSSSEKQTFLWNTIGSTGYNYETEPDLYQYSYPGGSGRFMIEKVDGVLVPRLMTSGDNIKIELIYNPSTAFSRPLAVTSFIITDTNGLIYVFDEIELMSSTISNFSRTQKSNQPEDMSGGPDHTNSFLGIHSAWHLTQILTPNGIELANFSYTPGSEQYQLSTITRNIITSTISNELRENICNNEIMKPKWSRNVNVLNSDKRDLQEIQFFDGTSIQLQIKSSTTHPETGGNVLESISYVGTDQNELKKYVMDYQTVNDRLWLNKITEHDVIDGSQNNHIFSYNQKENLPPQTSNTYPFGTPSDGWGYFNDATQDGEDTDPSVVTTGLLTSIQYPTGGTKNFVWESNNFSHGGGEDITPEQIDESMQSVNTRTVSKKIIFNGSSTPFNNDGVIASTGINLDFAQEVFVDFITPLTSSPWPSNPFQIIFKTLSIDGNPEIVQSFTYTQGRSSYSANLPAGSYSCQLILQIEQGTFDIGANIKFEYDEYYTTGGGPVTQLCAIYGGGVRISEVSFKEGSDIKREFKYLYNDTEDPCKSSGAVDGILGSLNREYTVSSNKHLFGTPGGQGCQAGGNNEGSFTPKNIQYLVISSGTKAQLSKGNYVGYKNVRVDETDNGHVTYEYTTAKDFPNPTNVLDYPFLPPKYLDHKRGLLIKREVFNFFDQILLSEINQYEKTEIDVGHAFRVINQESCEWTQFYDSYSQYHNTNYDEFKMPKCATIIDAQTGTTTAFPCFSSPINCGETTPYYSVDAPIQIGWSRLTGTNTTEYFYNGNIVQSTTSSNTYDYNDENYQVKEINRHFTEGGTPITIQSKNYYAVGERPAGSDLDQTANDLISVNKVNDPIYIEQYRLEGDGGNQKTIILSKTKNLYTAFASNQVELSEVHVAIRNDEMEQRIAIHNYDNYGNVVEVSKVNENGTDVHTVYLWGYNNSVPVARIDDIQYDNIPTAIQNIGNASESEIINLQSSLRSQFPNNQVTTFLYDKGMRLKEVRDPNNIATFYKYDGLDRLVRIEDLNNNVIEQYEYNYKN